MSSKGWDHGTERMANRLWWAQWEMYWQLGLSLRVSRDGVRLIGFKLVIIGALVKEALAGLNNGHTTEAGDYLFWIGWLWKPIIRWIGFIDHDWIYRKTFKLRSLNGREILKRCDCNTNERKISHYSRNCTSQSPWRPLNIRVDLINHAILPENPWLRILVHVALTASNQMKCLKIDIHLFEFLVNHFQLQDQKYPKSSDAKPVSGKLFVETKSYFCSLFIWLLTDAAKESRDTKKKQNHFVFNEK